jgi:hypothetical protein
MAVYAGGLAAEGRIQGGAPLHDEEEGARVRVRDGKTSVVDGPFTETKEIVGGYALAEFASRDEALKMAREFMELHRVHWPEFEGECEVRPVES